MSRVLLCSLSLHLGGPRANWQLIRDGGVWILWPRTLVRWICQVLFPDLVPRSVSWFYMRRLKKSLFSLLEGSVPVRKSG